MLQQPSRILIACGWVLWIGAAYHIIALIMGPDWLAFAGAPETIVESAKLGTWLAPVTTIAIAIIIFLMGTIPFAMAGRWFRWPFLRWLAMTLGILFVLRGVLFLPALFFGDLTSPKVIFHIFLSSLLFVIGIIILAGRQVSNTRQ